jgi:hypothetical protein
MAGASSERAETAAEARIRLEAERERIRTEAEVREADRDAKSFEERTRLDLESEERARIERQERDKREAEEAIRLKQTQSGGTAGGTNDIRSSIGEVFQFVNSANDKSIGEFAAQLKGSERQKYIELKKIADQADADIITAKAGKERKEAANRHEKAIIEIDNFLRDAADKMLEQMPKDSAPSSTQTPAANPIPKSPPATIENVNPRPPTARNPGLQLPAGPPSAPQVNDLIEFYRGVGQ